MAATVSFSFFIRKEVRKSDNTRQVLIRMTYLRCHAYLQTNFRVGENPFTKKGELKDTFISTEIKRLILRLTDIVNHMGDEISRYDNVKDLAEYIKDVLSGNTITKRNNEMDLICFWENYIENSRIPIGTLRNVKASLNKFKEYIGVSRFDVRELKSQHLTLFEIWLRENVKGVGGKPISSATVNNYLTYLRLIFNKMKCNLNDYDLSNIKIKNDPFRSFKLPKANVKENSAITIETIRKILNYESSLERVKLGRDVFLLSFMLFGMNTVDLYEATICNGRIEYERRKTRSRHADNASMSIKIEDELISYIERYKDTSGERAFDFYRRYANYDSFNKAVNKGLGIIEKDLGICVPNFTSYSARKSFATIMFDLGFSDNIVSDCLNHRGNPDTILARNVYRKNCKTQLDDCNRTLIDYLFQKGDFASYCGCN